MKVVLVGYMASGKSSVGELLARELHFKFLDLDAYIVEDQGKSIGKIFEESGELFFRQLESEMLKKALEAHADLVLATGGGTPCYGLNMQEILANSDHSVYLQVSVPTLVERIENAKAQRPLVSTIIHEDLSGFVQHHLSQRVPFYEKATHRVAGDTKTVEAVVAEIKALVSPF